MWDLVTQFAFCNKWTNRSSSIENCKWSHRDLFLTWQQNEFPSVVGALELCFHLHLFITCSPCGLLGGVSVSLPLCLHVKAADCTFLIACYSSVHNHWCAHALSFNHTALGKASFLMGLPPYIFVCVCLSPRGKGGAKCLSQTGPKPTEIHPTKHAHTSTWTHVKTRKEENSNSACFQ